MEFIKSLEAWFIVGSQHLYGPEALKQVEVDATEIVDYLNKQNPFVKIKLKPVATTPEEVYEVCKAANNQENCIGVIGADAHLLSSENVDFRTASILKTISAIPYAI